MRETLLLLALISTAHASTGTDLYCAEQAAKDIKIIIVQQGTQRIVRAKITRDNGGLIIYTCIEMPWEAWSTVVMGLGTVSLYDALNAPILTAPMPWIWTNKMSPPTTMPGWCLP